MPDIVPSEGSRRAPIILIGEAPGKWEHIYGKPFVGPSYTDRLLPWWNACTPRLTRDMFRILNVLDYQPERSGRHMDTVTESEIRGAAEVNVHAEIAAHEGPDGGGPMLIVPTGNYALYMLTGKGRVSWHMKDGKHLRPGIQKYRGSIMSYTDTRGRTFKVIPTVHPAGTMEFREPELQWVCQLDWQRIAEDMAFRELRLPEQRHLIAPSRGEAIEWLRWTRAEAEKRKGGEFCYGRLALSVDVETPKKKTYETIEGVSKSVAPGVKCRNCGHTLRWHTSAETTTACGGPRFKGCAHDCATFAPPLLKPKRKKIAEEAYLGCIGYSWDPAMSLTIPTIVEAWNSPEEWAAVKEEMRLTHCDPNIDKGGQNYSFDMWWCASEGMPIIGGTIWDLMKMHRVKRPWSSWHSLDFQASLDIRAEFWKDEAKDPDSIQRYADKFDALQTYCGMDNCGQRRLLPVHLEGLIACGRREYHDEMEAPMDPPLVKLSRTGIRVDRPGRQAAFEKHTAELKTLTAEINELAGEPIFGKIAVSVPKMRHFLYETLRLPVQYGKAVSKDGKKGKTISTDIVTIRRLMDRFPGVEKLKLVGPKVIRHRRLMTLRTFTKDASVEANGRMYGHFIQDTLLGRLSCSTPPRGRGKNLQNQDHDIRKFFLPDRGDEEEIV